ncbi:trehalose 6-phosphate phosphatase [Pseudomonas duriflava]|uniref:Trehalose 6-phosphate phosphatase n=1 Tax=Pseudomonas duriflava TaxID=459528 RepID=A0A562QFY3_9PSED|nr:trehalose-phosphatase [Pseudomonas duriflava]TWI55080.1 trehalose 6-phosphate phosphatase [Pseudomonas duriflava]
MTTLEFALPVPVHQCALFLDLDGTLAAIQPRPEQVFIPEKTLSAIDRLSRQGIPVTVVSGRCLDDIDRLIKPLTLPAAGVHGAERRDFAGTLHRLALDTDVLTRIASELSAALEPYPQLYLESKGMAFALHYRQAPELESETRCIAESFVTRYPDQLTLQPGKCVFELKPKGASKGAVIRTFMGETPFAGRLPVFLGDDLTDEAGFEVVNALGGLSIKIGEGSTLAQQRLESVEAVADWLCGLAQLADDPHIQQEEMT